MKLFRLKALLGGLLLCGLACAGDGTGVDLGNGNGNGGSATLSADVQPIFTSNCATAGCHVGNNPPPIGQGMDLSSGNTVSNTVNVLAAGASLDRIEPGNPDQSYLVHKIEGTQSQVGGGGGRMPLGGSALSATEIATIRSWIAAGALDN